MAMNEAKRKDQKLLEYRVHSSTGVEIAYDRRRFTLSLHSSVSSFDLARVHCEMRERHVVQVTSAVVCDSW